MMANLHINPRMYMAVQRMGAHSVHGTWTELVLDYLEIEPDGTVHPRACNVEPHHNQFTLIMRLVLDAMDAFASYMVVAEGEAQELHDYVELMRRDVIELDEADYGQDFEPAE